MADLYGSLIDDDEDKKDEEDEQVKERKGYDWQPPPVSEEKQPIASPVIQPTQRDTVGSPLEKESPVAGVMPLTPGRPVIPSPVGSPNGAPMPPALGAGTTPTTPSSAIASPLPSWSTPATPPSRYDAEAQAGAPIWNKKGFGGALLKGLDIAGNILVPGVMANIPGTTVQHRVEMAQELKKEQADAAAQAGRTSEAEKQAQTATAQQETENLRNPPEKQGLTPEETTIHDLMTGNNGQPRINPQTQKPYNYLEAFTAVKRTGQEVKPETGNDFEQFYKQKVKEGLADTAANRQTAYAAWVKNEPQFQAAQAQRETANAMREQTQTLAKQNATEREEKEGLKWVTGADKDGNIVAMPFSEAKKEGVQNAAELPAQEVRDVQNARHAVKLMTKVGDPNKPETMGVLQLIDSLDKDNKLGVVASRWNRFSTQGIGASPDDDPRVVTLIDKNMLADTATMLAHFGASGGRSPQMLQHFLDLSNSGKMDGVTLRTGTLAIADYMKDRAMLPQNAEMTYIKASDGTLHDIPSDKLDAAKKIDPKLQVIK